MSRNLSLHQYAQARPAPSLSPRLGLVISRSSLRASRRQSAGDGTQRHKLHLPDIQHDHESIEPSTSNTAPFRQQNLPGLFSVTPVWRMGVPTGPW